MTFLTKRLITYCIKRLFQMKENVNSWVFSFKEDCLLLAICLLASLLVIAIAILNSPLGQNYYDWIRPTLFIGIFFDISHVFATYFVIFNERKKLSLILKSIPLICLCTLFILNKFSISFFKFYVLMSLYHFIRQQFGILMITLKKGRKLTNIEVIYNRIFFYNLMCTPILYFMTSKIFIFEWISIPFNYYTKINHLSNLCLIIFFSIIGLQILFELKEIRRHQIFNTPKIFHSTITFILWFLVPYSLKTWAGPSIGIIIIHHATFYFTFCYKRLPFRPRFSVLIHYTAFLIPTFIYIYLVATHKALTMLLASTTLTHFIWDAFIWKKMNYIKK